LLKVIGRNEPETHTPCPLQQMFAVVVLLSPLLKFNAKNALTDLMHFTKILIAVGAFFQ